MTSPDSPELVVLADANGKTAGTADKATIHTADTPLHFAFSTWVVRRAVDEQGLEVLITRRALTKKTWPGVWTNAFCGHPGPGESNLSAVRRRSVYELGLPAESLENLEEIVPDFAYRAVDSSGIVENEICPVFFAHVAADVQLSPNPDEVDSYFWVSARNIIAAADATPLAFSPWLVKELADARLRRALLRSTN